MTRNQSFKRFLSGTIGAVMFLSSLPGIAANAVVGTTVLTYDDYEVSYAVTNEWEGGRNVLITVTNLSDESLYNWAFKYDEAGTMENLYNAVVFDNEDTQYVIKNNGWNFEIAPQRSVSFGYTVHGDELTVPSEFELCSERIDVTEGYEVEVEYVDTWNDGMRGEIIVTNTTEEPLEAWTLAFDTNFQIEYVWNGRAVDTDGNHYVITSEAWTQYLAPGESKSIGFVGTIEPGTDPEFSNYALSAVKINGIEEEGPNIDIDMDTDNIDLGYIENLIGADLITANFDENSQIRAIDGKFTNKPLNSAEDAAAILNCAHTLFGSRFSADSANISVQTAGDETYYRTSATINGVPVMGSQIILSAKDGEVTGLFSTYKRNAENVNTTATITEEAAVEAVYNDIFTTFSDTVDAVVEYSGLTEEEVLEVLKASFEVTPILAVYAKDTTPALVWLVQIVNDNDNYDEEEDEEIEIDYTDINDYGKYVFNFINRQYYIQANGQNAGSIIRMTDGAVAGWETVSADGTDQDLLGQPRDFDVQFKEGGLFTNDKYRMRDGNRNIETYYTTYDWLTDVPQLPGEMYQSGSNTWSDQTSVSIHANMSDIYDFYKGLGRDSYDNDHAKIKITTKFREADWSFFGIPIWGNQEYHNAYWNGSQIVFGDAGNYAACKDVLAHEFTHAVDDYVIYDTFGPITYARGLDYEGESGALNEAYSDIMGMLAEGKAKTDSGRWQNGEDTGNRARSFESPGPDYADHYSALTDPAWSTKLDGYVDRDNEGVHIFSTIVTHAVYLMMTDEWSTEHQHRTASVTDDEWAKLFYNSMFKLGTDSDFHDFRYSVLSCAKALGFTSDEQTAIKEAFDEVGITEPESLRIVLEWGATPSDLDSHLTGPAVSGSGRFHTYYSAKNYYVNGSYNATGLVDYAAELDYDDTSSFGPEITTIHRYTPGDYYFYVHDYSNLSSSSSTAMSTSGVTVSIYQGSSNTLAKLDDGTDAQFTIPSSRIATLWKVCKITIDSTGNVTITKWDTYSNHSNPATVGN